MMQKATVTLQTAVAQARQVLKKGFAARHTAPRLSRKTGMNLTILIDQSSIELFADNGLSVMTEIFFPEAPLSAITLQSPDKFRINTLQYAGLKSIWKQN